MQIVSASRRTDIPAFYAPWLLRRLEAGYARVPNPFNPRQISTVDLRPERVAALVLWTRDPRPLLPHLEKLDARGYRYQFTVTLTGMPPVLEPAVPPAEAIVETLQELGRRLGPDRTHWRFDPILLSTLTPEDRILATFEHLCASLAGAVGKVTVSFARYYRQVRTRLRRRRELEKVAFFDPDAMPAAEALVRLGPLAAGLSRIAARHGLPIVSCAEKFDLQPFGIAAGRCIDREQLQRSFGLALSPRKDSGQRPECGCLPSLDLGVYGTCRHGCVYCYAALDRALVRGERHDPQGEMLLGRDRPAPESQLTLF